MKETLSIVDTLKLALEALERLHYELYTHQGDDAITAIEAVLAQPQRKPLTKGEIYTAYITATDQTLRPQDERLVFAFARAIEAAHGIKENT